MKISLAFFALLFLVASAQAQHSHSRGSFNCGSGNLNWNLGGQVGGTTISSREHALHYEPPREFTMSYATNDGDFVASTFMNYDEAVALGRQQLAAAEQRKTEINVVSLAEVARVYRASKTLKLEAQLIQGESGKLEVCNLKSGGCRRL